MFRGTIKFEMQVFTKHYLISFRIQSKTTRLVYYNFFFYMYNFLRDYTSIFFTMITAHIHNLIIIIFKLRFAFSSIIQYNSFKIIATHFTLLTYLVFDAL